MSLGTAATTAFSAAGGIGATQATTVLPSMGVPDETLVRPRETKGRNPWTWPLIALIGILIVVLVGTLIALIASPGPSKPSASPTVTTQSKSPTPSPTPTNERIRITKDQFLGMTESEVRAELDKLGLVANVLPPGKAANTSDQEGTVYDVNPTGNVLPGDTISVTLYGPIAPPSKPADPTASAPATPPSYTPGEVVTVSWTPFTCTSGTTLDSYTVAVSPGSVVWTPGNPVAKGTTSIKVTLPSTVTGSTTTVQYLAQCSGTKSPTSNAVTLTVPGAPPATP